MAHFRQKNFKIVLVAPYFYPHKGGLEQFCFELANRFSKKNHKVIVITSDKKFKKEKIGKIKIVRLEGFDLLKGRFPLPKISLKNLKTLREIYFKKPDITILNTRFFPINFLVAIFSKIYKTKIIHIEHGTTYPKLESFLKSLIAKIYDNTFGRLTISFAEKVVGISTEASLFVKKLGAKNPKVIYNSVDTNFFKRKKEAPKDKINIVFIGRLIEAKGVQDLIEAFKKIKGENLNLDIVGDGFFKSSLERMAKKDKRIKFLGEKNQEEIKEILEQSHILVNPSYSEGLPTSVLEAGAMEVSVLATNVGGTGEIIDDGKNGFLIKPKDTKNLKKRLTILAKNSKIREKFAKMLRKKIEEKFDWSKNIEKFLEIIKKCKK